MGNHRWQFPTFSRNPDCVGTLRADKPNFLEFWLKMAQMTLKVKVNDLHFHYQPRVSQDACLVQIWWFQLKFLTSYRADKVKFTDRRTDGQTQTTTIPLRPDRPWGNKSLLKQMITQFTNTVETLYSTIYYSKYFIELNNDKSTQYVALWTHKRHPISRPFGRALECLLWVLQQKLIVL